MDLDPSPAEPDSSAALNEKQPQGDETKPSQTQEVSASKDAAANESAPQPSSSAATPVALPPLDVSAPPAAADKDVILPPTPRTLPEAETHGITSGAVQAPGSTGEEPARAQTQHDSSGDESEGTSFTEDDDVEEGPLMDEVEDDEERLILNGGAGIPIGPVRSHNLFILAFISVLTCIIISGRRATTSLAASFPPTRGAKMLGARSRRDISPQ